MLKFIAKYWILILLYPFILIGIVISVESAFALWVGEIKGVKQKNKITP